MEAGKDVYLQKPASLTIAEGRALSDIVHRTGQVFQIGSQQRPTFQFRVAAELVRNGRIGTLQTVEVGLPGEPSGPDEPEMPVPENPDYEMWLGWGAHHVDSAHWGMGTEYTGPIAISGTAEFPTSGLWDVHGPFRTEGLYANGVRMIVSGDLPNGVKFIGSDGWIFVSRGDEGVTASDPVDRLRESQALVASTPAILTSAIGEDEMHLPVSQEHHGNWLEAIRTRQQPIAPVEVAHRSCSACLLHHIAMKLPRTLRRDPMRDRFHDDDEANAMLSRPQRAPYLIPS